MPCTRLRVASSLLATVITCVFVPPAASAAQPAPVALDLPAQPLGDALRAVGRATGRQIMFPSDATEGMTAPAMRGRFAADEAIRRLLVGTGLTASFTSEVVLIGGRAAAASSDASTNDDSSQIVVTGSRIRGGPITTPVLRITRSAILDSGQTSVADAVATLPQAFGGGLNRGIGIGVPEGNGLNFGTISTVNLRGLGSDATLTLLNGHRLAYSAITQSIDIASIPLDAVESLEVVADGASAIYGSDAVAGVANIRLRKDYQGAAISARVGGSTDGGDFQQQYTAVAGTTWASGGIIAAYEYEDDSSIQARQRSYTKITAPGLTLLPSNRHHDVLVSAHQAIGTDLTFSVDGLYNVSDGRQAFALDPGGDVDTLGERNHFRNSAFAIVPSLRLSLPASWQVELLGTYAQAHSRYESGFFVNGSNAAPVDGCYCNSSYSVELSADGTLLALPGGDAKLALGGGYRSNIFHGFRTQGTAQDIRAKQPEYFGYAELSVPLISDAQSVPWLQRLAVNAAVRHEHYRDVGSVWTPKLGAILSPGDDFDIKGSWGRSFKVPTLYERFANQYTELDFATNYGASNVPASATGLLIGGGNPDLKPEHATTWSATLDLHPRAVAGLTVQVSYFDVSYRNRVVNPIQFQSAALSDPSYANYILLNPSAAAQLSAQSGRTFSNYTGSAYDPADVVALIDASNVNAETQKAHGVDAIGAYNFAFVGGNLTLDANVSYIHSVQRLSDLQAVQPLAGTLFNVPHWKGRGGLAWSDDAALVSTHLTTVGGVRDTRKTPSTSIGGMTSWDMFLRYKLPDRGSVLSGIALALTVSNILNAHPKRIAVPAFFIAPYDSTNYSVQGRFVAFTIAKTL